DPGQGRALLAELEEDLAQAVVRVGTSGDVPLGTAHGEGRGLARALLRQAAAYRTRYLYDLRLLLILLFALDGGERLADLAVVPVDRERLQPQLPALEVAVLDVVDRGLLRHVHRLGDGAGEERLGRGHHAYVAHRLDVAAAHRAVEDLVVLRAQAGGVEDVAVLGHVLHDRLDLLVLVIEVDQAARDGLVDD